MALRQLPVLACPLWNRSGSALVKLICDKIKLYLCTVWCMLCVDQRTTSDSAFAFHLSKQSFLFATVCSRVAVADWLRKEHLASKYLHGDLYK